MALVENLNIFIRAYNRTKPAFNMIGRGLDGLRKSVFSVQSAIVGLAGGAGFGLFIRSTIETNRQFQSLEASLKTFTGSTEAASTAFKVLQDFAAQTPFSLQEVVGGFNRLISVGLNPSISALEAFGNIASGTGKTLEQFVEAAADAAVGEFERLKEFGIKARSEGDKVTFTFKGVETTVKKSASTIQDFLINLGQTEFSGAIAEQSKTLNGAFSNLRDSFESFQKKIGEAGFNKAVITVAKNLSRIFNNGDKLADLIGKKLAVAIEGAYKGFLTLATGVIGFGVALREYEAGNIRFVDIVTRTKAEMKLMRDAIDKAMASVGSGAISIAELDKNLQKANVSVSNQPHAWKDAIDALNEYKNALPEVKKAIGDALVGGLKKLEDGLTDVIMGAKSVKDAFKDMAKSVIRDLIRIQIQRTITGPLAGGMADMFGKLQPKAIGGAVQANRGYLVGERGPEMFVPNAAGSIVPNKNITGGGVTVNQTVNISTGVSQTVRAEITQMLPQIQDAAKAAVVDARRRGGSFAGAFGG